MVACHLAHEWQRVGEGRVGKLGEVNVQLPVPMEANSKVELRLPVHFWERTKLWGEEDHLVEGEA